MYSHPVISSNGHLAYENSSLSCFIIEAIMLLRAQTINNYCLLVPLPFLLSLNLSDEPPGFSDFLLVFFFFFLFIMRLLKVSFRGDIFLYCLCVILSQSLVPSPAAKISASNLLTSIWNFRGGTDLPFIFNGHLPAYVLNLLLTFLHRCFLIAFCCLSLFFRCCLLFKFFLHSAPPRILKNFRA